MQNNNFQLNANFFDLFGITRTKYFFWIVILVSIALIYFEISFNIDLLNSISDPKSTVDDAKNLSSQGKLLSSVGIAWAIGRGLLNHKRPAILSLIFAGALAAVIYVGLDHLYSKVVSSLDPKYKKSGIELLSYRKDLLNDDVRDQEIPLPKNQPVIGKIFMGSFPIAVVDGRFKVPAEEQYKYKQTAIVNSAESKAEERWQEYKSRMDEISTSYSKYLDNANIAVGQGNIEPKWEVYNKNMYELSNQYDKYIDASNRALGRANNERDWNEYNGMTQAILHNHERFKSESKKALSWGSLGRNKFIKESGGYEPNPYISREDFVKIIRNSNNSEAQKFKSFENRQIATSANGRPIYGRNMPLFMNKSQFNQWNSNVVNEGFIANGLRPNPELSKVEFIQMLRKSDGRAGQEFRVKENNALSAVASGAPVEVRDVPYFMNKNKFNEWYAGLAKDALVAGGYKIDPNMTINEFLQMLRDSDTKESKTLRSVENKAIITEKTAAKFPGLKALYVKDVPYFMSHNEYQKWYKSKGGDYVDKNIPTLENVEKFENIDDLSAAIYLPPLAIIFSLSSAVLNSIAVIISLFIFSLGFLRKSKVQSLTLQKYSSLLAVSVFLILYLALPSNVFKKDTPQIFDLENKIHQQYGFLAVAWSKLSNLQKLVLEIHESYKN